MKFDPLTVDRAIEVLNELVEADPEVARAIVEMRVPCNDQLADHPSIQVARREPKGPATYCLGFLGLLNGLFGTDERGWGPIAAVVEIVCPNKLCPCYGKDAGAMEGEPCPECGTTLVCGKVVKFRTSEGCKPAKPKE